MQSPFCGTSEWLLLKQISIYMWLALAAWAPCFVYRKYQITITIFITNLSTSHKEIYSTTVILNDAYMLGSSYMMPANTALLA